MKELEILFGSNLRPKILKLFFQNEGKEFSLDEIAKKCRSEKNSVKREIEKLKKIGLFSKKIKKRKAFYSLDSSFPFLRELRQLILSVVPLSLKELPPLFRKKKDIELVLASGVFLGETRSPVDLLIVSKKPKISSISSLIKKIETLVGKEIRWTLMSREEFDYRRRMHDRFLKEIFDRSYKKIIDKIKIQD